MWVCMRLEGMYSTIEEAGQGVEGLKNQGYTHHDITVAMNRETREQLDIAVDAEIATHEGNKVESVWESIKNFFTLDDVYERLGDDTDVNIPSEYAEDIQRGKIAVFINSDAQKMDPFDPDSPEEFATDDNVKADTGYQEADEGARDNE